MPSGLVDSTIGLTFNQSMIIIFVAVVVMLIAAAIAGYYILRASLPSVAALAQLGFASQTPSLRV